MGIEKTVFRRLMPRRAVRRLGEDQPLAGDGKEAAPPESLAEAGPAGAKEPGLRDILGSIRAIIHGEAPGNQTPGNQTGAAPHPPMSKAQQSNLIVMLLMTIDVLLGTAIGVVGFFVLGNDGVALAGAVLATGGIFLMLFFQLLGKER